jgi:hypothetical protein
LTSAEEDDLLARVERERDGEEAGEVLDSGIHELGEVGLDVVSARDLANNGKNDQLKLCPDEV